MLLSEYIEMLQRKRRDEGDFPVAITQSGYYADGQFADLYEEAELQEINLRGGYRWVSGVEVKQPDQFEQFYVLGHSSQSY